MWARKRERLMSLSFIVRLNPGWCKWDNFGEDCMNEKQNRMSIRIKFFKWCVTMNWKVEMTNSYGTSNISGLKIVFRNHVELDLWIIAHSATISTIHSSGFKFVMWTHSCLKNAKLYHNIFIVFLDDQNLKKNLLVENVEVYSQKLDDSHEFNFKATTSFFSYSGEANGGPRDATVPQKNFGFFKEFP